MTKEEKTEASPDLDAMLDPKKWKEKLRSVQRVIDSATMLKIRLSNEYRIWDEYITRCTQGEEFSIAVGYPTRFRQDEIYIESRDGILTAQRVGHHPSTDTHGLHIDEIVLDTRRRSVIENRWKCGDTGYKEFLDRVRKADHHTISGKRADL
jgi:hypothetical protein